MKLSERMIKIYAIQLSKNLSYGKAALIYDAKIEKQIQKEIKNKHVLHCRDVTRTREYDKYIKVIPTLCEHQVERKVILLDCKSFLALPVPKQCGKCRRIAVRRTQGIY